MMFYGIVTENITSVMVWPDGTRTLGNASIKAKLESKNRFPDAKGGFPIPFWKTTLFS